MTSGGFKITYSTLAEPSAQVHESFERALSLLAPELGARHALYIDGRPVTDRDTFADDSPIDTRLRIGSFARATAQDASAAVAAAERAFAVWRRVPWPERVRLVRAAAERLSAQRYQLAALMALEVGKTRFEALADAEEAADLFRYYAQTMEDAQGFERPMGQLSPNERTRDLLRPWGVWVVISPFNFPLALAAGMAAGALLGGNTVVFNPASEAAATGLRLYQALAAALADAGLPPGTFNFLTGPGGEAGDALMADPRVAGLAFTGSLEVGSHLHRIFSRDLPRPSLLELGGKNPAIVTARADLEQAAEGIFRSAFSFGGQKCSACSRVYVEQEVARELTERLVAKAQALRIGDPREREVFLGPVINQAAVRRFERAAELARRDGRVLTGGRVLRDGDLARGHYVEPTLVSRLSDNHELVREELFLPFLCLAEVRSLEHALELANRSEYGLTAGVFTQDPQELETFFEGIEAGVAYANRRSGATTGAWPGVNPFCGWKSSGTSGKGVCGPYYVQQFMREQSRTVME